jgi:hypothetical protein
MKKSLVFDSAEVSLACSVCTELADLSSAEGSLVIGLWFRGFVISHWQCL